MTKHKFSKFREAMDFLDAQRKAGREGILYPSKGGDNLRKWTTEPEEHTVILLDLPEVPNE